MSDQDIPSKRKLFLIGKSFLFWGRIKLVTPWPKTTFSQMNIDQSNRQVGLQQLSGQIAKMYVILLILVSGKRLVLDMHSYMHAHGASPLKHSQSQWCSILAIDSVGRFS